MAKALQFTGGPEVKETAKFVDMFDKFFDCLNVNNFTAGYHKRKDFQQPYRSAGDFRLQVCIIIVPIKFAHMIDCVFIIYSGWRRSFSRTWMLGKAV